MEGPAETATDCPAPSVADRRRFGVAALVAMAVGAVPFVWILWAGRLDPLRGNPSGFWVNFFDLQGRSLLDGRWDVPRGSLGIEGFVVDGREYMYFGPLPAFLRMPILAVTDRLDSRLTSPSMLLAWAVTGLFVSLLIWRVRTMVRGAVPLSRSEAAAAGLIVLAVTTGSTMLTLASFPSVYVEAEIWGVALAVGSLWALLGLAEQPSAGRLVMCGAIITGAVLSRLTLGWACVIGALLMAVWFATGRAGPRARTAWVRVVLVAVLIPLAAGAAVNFAKFDDPSVQPMEANVFTQEDEQRQAALDANGGRLYSPSFVPTTAWAYLRPDALRLSAEYPFVTMPERASPVVGDVVLDRIYRTSSVPSSMLLLTILGVGGVAGVICSRRRPWAQAVGITMLAGAAGFGGVLMWGATAQRTLGDALPFLAVGSATGLVVGWRMLDRRSRRERLGALAVVALLTGFGLVANFGIATEMSGLSGEGEWAEDYVDTQVAVSEVIGRAPDIERREALPAEGDPAQLVVLGDCEGLYLGTGEQYPPQWHAVDHGPGQRHLADLVYREAGQGPVRLLDIEPGASLSVEDRDFEATRWMRFVFEDRAGEKLRSRWVSIATDRPYRVDLRIDRGLGAIRVLVDGEEVVTGWNDLDIVDGGRRVNDDPPQADVAWRDVPEPALCRELEVDSAAP